MIPNYPYFGLPNYLKNVNSNTSFHTSYNSIKSQAPHRFSSTASHSAFSGNSRLNSKNTSFKREQMSNYTASQPCKFNSSGNNNFNQKQPKSNHFSQGYPPLFNLFGINIYFDDILLVCIIFFLYNENIADPYLLFILVLLLLN